MLRLGLTSRRKPVSLTNEERCRHVHLIGASGTGKSKMLESMLRQDLTAGRGLCLIDPHGTLADDVIAWCAAVGLDKFRKVHVVEPSDVAWSLGFNPLRADGQTETAARVDAMVAACAQVWGGESTNATPLLKKCLRAVFYALAVRNLTLVEAPFLTNASEADLRRHLTEELPDAVFDSVWRDFDGLSRREFFEQFQSTNNRMLEFLSSPVIRRIVGQRDGALDLRRVMDDGEVLIVNLAYRGALSPDNARLLGTLITSELFLLALSRDARKARERPFSLYIDECYDFLTGDIERMLDQTRKFGLHLVLAHQRLGQLRQRSDAIYNGVMAGGQTKVVFGGLMDDDAEVMAREVMRTSLKLERPKHALDKPVVVDEVPYWLDSVNWSESEAQSQSTSESSTWGVSDSLSAALTESFDAMGVQIGGHSLSNSLSTGSFDGGGSSSSETFTTASSRGGGKSQTLRSVRQIMPTAVHSLDEEMHLAIIKLRELPNQAAIVKRRGRPPVRIRPETIKPALVLPTRAAEFVERSRHGSPYIAATVTAELEISRRDEALREAAGVRPSSESDFWTEEPAKS